MVSAEDGIYNIQKFIEAFKMNENQVGILLNPTEDSISYNIRELGEHPLSPSMDWEVENTNLDDSYSDWVEKFEREFDEAELQYLEPEVYEKRIICEF